MLIIFSQARNGNRWTVNRCWRRLRIIFANAGDTNVRNYIGSVVPRYENVDPTQAFPIKMLAHFCKDFGMLNSLNGMDSVDCPAQVNFAVHVTRQVITCVTLICFFWTRDLREVRSNQGLLVREASLSLGGLGQTTFNSPHQIVFIYNTKLYVRSEKYILYQLHK